MTDATVIRQGGPDDIALVLGMLDRATAWLATQGRTDQWGTEPHSTSRRRIDQVTSFADRGWLHIAQRGAEPVAALAIGDAPEHIPYCAEPHLYVNLLVADPSGPGKGAGAALLEFARTVARQRGLGLLRVDCFRGADRALIGYYERQGFTAAEEFSVSLPSGDWPGQVLRQRLS